MFLNSCLRVVTLICLNVVSQQSLRNSCCLSWKEILYRILGTFRDFSTTENSHASILEAAGSYFNTTFLVVEKCLTGDWIVFTDLLH